MGRIAQFIAHKEQVEVKNAWSVWLRANSTEQAFDPQEAIEDLFGGMVSLDRGDGIEELRLIGRPADRIGLVE